MMNTSFLKVLPVRPIWGLTLLSFVIMNAIFSITITTYGAVIKDTKIDIPYCNTTSKPQLYNIQNSSTLCNGTIFNITEHTSYVFIASIATSALFDHINEIITVVLIALMIIPVNNKMKYFIDNCSTALFNVSVVFSFIMNCTNVGIMFLQIAQFALSKHDTYKVNVSDYIHFIIILCIQVIFNGVKLCYAALAIISIYLFFRSQWTSFKKYLTIAYAVQVETLVFCITPFIYIFVFLTIGIYRFTMIDFTQLGTMYLDIFLAIADISCSLCFASLFLSAVLYYKLENRLLMYSTYIMVTLACFLVMGNEALVLISRFLLLSNQISAQRYSLDAFGYITVVDSGLKSAFVFVWLFCVFFVIAVHYRSVSWQWHTTNATNIDLTTPLMEDISNKSNSNTFEKEIQPWIVDIEELSFDKRISEGSYGVVFRGKYRGSNVAIKKMKMQDDDLEFEHEVKMLLLLRHPNIVLFMGACIGTEFKIIVTEAMAKSLDNVIHKVRISDKQPNVWHISLTLDQKIHILKDVASAVLFIHAKGICHRDLKPSNILLDENCSIAKVCDFGTSRNVVTTMTGNIGTLFYMSPEVLHNKSYTESCDVYSFAIIMHELFFEVKPYADEEDELEFLNPFTLGTHVTNGRRPTIPDMSTASDRELQYVELLKKCWSHLPSERPNFKQILETLTDM